MLDYFLTEHPLTSLIIAIVLVTAIAVAVVVIPSSYAVEYKCSQRAAMLKAEYQYDFWTGCWVKQPDNTWVEYTTIRNVGVK